MFKDPHPPIAVSFTGAVKLDIPQEMFPVMFENTDITGRLWELAGAFDGSEIQARMSTVGTEEGSVQAIRLKVSHPVLLARPMQRWIYRVDDGLSVIDVIENVEFYLNVAYQGQGIGKTSLLVEALAAHELKFQQILAIAAGSPRDRRHLGWKVWPKLGYDAIISKDIVNKMPRERLETVNLNAGGDIRISDLIDHGIYDLWEQHGEGCT